MPVSQKGGVSALSLSSCAVLLALTGCTLSNTPSITAAAPEIGMGMSVGEYYSLDGVRYYGDGEYSHTEVGEASWYGADFHGNRTANGEIYDRFALTAAHPSLDLPSIARVTNLNNDRSVIVRINDRGPYAGDRIIDVSEQAARRLGFVADGVAEVRVEVLPEETNLAARIDDEGGETLLAGVASAMRRGNSGRATDALVRDESDGLLQAAALADDVEAMDAVRSGMRQPAYVPTSFYVEAGTWLIRENAERALLEIPTAASPRITSRLVEGTWLYRIQLGPHSTVNEADASVSQLREEGHTDAVIVRN
ncbi:septal ring lytic transglycosylase RlpA family protein [Fodinicurvata sp. EGI_FJ10296]|uniref:septal ring lytic transglycosylase RlpA family protein n=1 Tax=Fodinicurvata sp. EGI_FJ10296 TaxID=3231908 RepID=UPI0034545D22